jgi:hypothetical protein
MDRTTQNILDDLRSDDKEIRYHALLNIMEITGTRVEWAYQVWDEMLANLKHKDNHIRAIAAQVLCNLAISDPENRMLKDFEAILDVTRDDRFVTARHSLLAIWKVGLAGTKQKKMTVDGLEYRYRECATEKNCTLIRYDIIKDLRNLYDKDQDEMIREKALELIEVEENLKYRKKYAGLWRDN